MRLRPERDAARRARQAVERLGDQIDDTVLDNVRLVVSELVTNSVRHARLARDDPIDLHLESDDDVVRIEVTDRGTGFVLDRPPTPGDTSGWGLFIIDRLADRWGVDTDGRTRVWAEILSGQRRERP